MTHTGKEPAFAKFIQIDDAIASENRESVRSLERTLNLDSDEEMIEITENKTRKKAEPKDTAEKTKKADKLETLKQKLKNAIAEEDYELAAKLRDSIKSLEDEASNEKPKKKSSPKKKAVTSKEKNKK